MTHRTLAVVSAGLSQPSSTRLLSDQLADATRRRIESSGAGVHLTVIELRELALDVTNRLLTGFPSPVLQQALDAVTGADGLIAVTPLYSASYSGLFKSFFDVVDADALAGKPVIIGATGGTARHSLALEHALRPLFTYLQAFVVPTGVFAASPDWGSGGNAPSSLSDRIERASDELARLVSAGSAAGPDDPYDSPTPFAELLGR